MHRVGFEPTRFATVVLETTPLDHSGTDAFLSLVWKVKLSGKRTQKGGGTRHIKSQGSVLEKGKKGSVWWSEKKEKKSGDAGYRSPCPSHAKRMLYHLSYIPSAQVMCEVFIISAKQSGMSGSKNASGGVRTHAFCNSRS